MSEPAPPDLYETDFVAWAERQAAALRALPDPSPFGLDLPNLIEEVESLARREQFELEERVRSALVRLLLAAVDPDPDRSRAALSGVSGPLIEARGLRSPTALSRLDPDLIWSDAREEAEAGLPSGALEGAPGPCPFRPKELLARGFCPQAALARLRRHLSGEAEGPGVTPDPV
jgi:hypothetical protein